MDGLSVFGPTVGASGRLRAGGAGAIRSAFEGLAPCKRVSSSSATMALEGEGLQPRPARAACLCYARQAVYTSRATDREFP